MCMHAHALCCIHVCIHVCMFEFHEVVCSEKVEKLSKVDDTLPILTSRSFLNRNKSIQADI